MDSLRSSVRARNFARAGLAVVFVVAVQALGSAIVWPQDPVSQRLDEEFAKQDNIYRRRGADIASGYTINRGLAEYAEVLPTSFCGALSSLSRSERWLDIGAGEGQAILDYYASEDHSAAAEKCGRSSAKADVVAMSIEDRRTDKWRERRARDGAGRMKYLAGRSLQQYQPEELGKFHLITDVFGGFTYTGRLSQFVDKVLALLEIGGSFYTLVQGVRLEDGKDKLGTWYRTELVDADGRNRKMCSWLKRTTCTQVKCESKSDWDSPAELIHIRKLCSEVSVPPLLLLEYRAGVPPGRRFELAQ